MQQTGSKAVLHDLTEMQPMPVNVLLYQRLLDEHVRHLDLRRAIVVPNTQIAHLARLAFGVGDYKLFYDDLEAARRFLRDAEPVLERRLARPRHRRTPPARAQVLPAGQRWPARAGPDERLTRHRKTKRVAAISLQPVDFIGGVDGARTRDPRRDRPVF